MKLGFFTMPIHPLGKDWRQSLQEDREAFILADDGGEIGGKETAVEPARTAGRSDGAADEVHGAKIGDDAGFGEWLPRFGRRRKGIG